MLHDLRRSLVAASGLGLMAVVAGWAGLAVAGSGDPGTTVTATIVSPPVVGSDGALHFLVVAEPRPAGAGPAAVENVATPIHDDPFTGSLVPRWRVIAGKVGVKDGRLVATGQRDLAVVGDVQEQDVRAAVDALASAQMGVLLRYQDPGNFVLAFYTPGARIIGFHEAIDGKLGPWLGATSTAGLSGRSLHVVAEAVGSRASLIVTDEQGHRVLARTPLTRLLRPGSVGLYHDASVPAPQSFDNLAVARLERRLPADAIEVVVPSGNDDESQVWSLGRRATITGFLLPASPPGPPRAILRVARAQDIAPVVEPAPLRTLFPINNPGRQWHRFTAEGFPDASACGVIYRAGDTVVNGMPLGGVDTGCVDLETSGLLGYSTIFNTHVPRRGHTRRQSLTRTAA